MAIGILKTDIDYNALIKAAMDAESNKLHRLEKKKEQYLAQYTNVETLSNSLGSLSDSLLSLQEASENTNYLMSSSNTAVVAPVVVQANTGAGQHTLTVSKLASVSQLSSSSGFSSNTVALGVSGTLVLSVNGMSSSVTYENTDSLDSISTAINSSSSNPGLYASVLSTTNQATGVAEYELLLTSNNSGAANAITLSGDVAALNLSTPNVLLIASDATFTFDGFYVERSTNTISDVLSGAVFTLLAPTATAVTLSITEDTTTNATNLNNAITNFVTTYNSLVGQIDTIQSHVPMRNSSFPALKDNLIDFFQGQYGTTSVNYFADLGITMSRSQTKYNDENTEYVTYGNLQIDQNQLTQAIQLDYASVVNFFTSTSNGFLTAASNYITDELGPDGFISVGETTLIEQGAKTTNDIAEEKIRLEKKKFELTKRFAEVSSTTSRLEHLTKYLDNVFKSMRHDK